MATGLLVNEFLTQKRKRVACAFIESSLFYATMNQNEKEYVISIVPHTRSIYRRTESSPSIGTLRGEFTGHCCSLLLLPLAHFYFSKDSFYQAVPRKSLTNFAIFFCVINFTVMSMPPLIGTRHPGIFPSELSKEGQSDKEHLLLSLDFA